MGEGFESWVVSLVAIAVNWRICPRVLDGGKSAFRGRRSQLEVPKFVGRMREGMSIVENVKTERLAHTAAVCNV